MSEESKYFGGPEGSVPEYNQTDDMEINRLKFTSGIYKDIEDELEVVECDPLALAIQVLTGWAFVYGAWLHVKTDPSVKSLAAADPDNPRIDRIVLRLDTTEDFKISSEVLTGTPGADPDPPELTQTASIYEIPLAQVLVIANATSVDDEDITDEREYTGVPNADMVGGITAAELATLVGVETLTNKRMTRRVGSIASTASLTVDADSYDLYKVTALAEAITVNAPSGTPTDGQTLILTFKDNGTGRVINWNEIFVGIGVTLPAITVAGKRLKVGLMYSSDSSKWECPGAVAQEA